METQAILALLAFGVVSSFTPGPNNLMLMASGANFGVRRTMPHMMGVVIGFSLMIVILGLGLFGLFHAWPASFTVLKVVSVVYTLYLAWKIARAAPPGTGNPEGKPMTFLQAAAFQWVNPKAWTMGLSAITLYAPDARLVSILIIAGVFGFMSLASTGTWMMMGLSIRRWLSSHTRLLAYNYSMAALLVGSIALAV
ncbi:MAG TPA: LysE family translocator [Sphingobium sp.]|uniref:LysE family translocator n=1 Tax=Sphingobium sp. TaxID=1912891 RepID=UPI002ED2A708